MNKQSNNASTVKGRKSPVLLLTRAGVVAALYAVMTYAFGSLAYGPLQIRPAEALCMLPLFFPETIVGLFVGCALSNLMSGFGLLDIVFGSLTTLIAAGATWAIGRAIKNRVAGAIVGGLPPVIFNAAIIPFVIIFASPDGSMAFYWTYFLQLLLTETVWVYALGLPMILSLGRMRDGGASFLN